MANNSILAKMTVQIAANTAQFLSAMDKLDKRLNIVDNTVGRLAKTLTVAFVGHKIFQAFEYGIGVMKDFERQIDTVAALSGATGDELKQLEKNAIDLAGAFRSIDIAKMETELARLGFSTKEIINSTKAIVDLATATGEDLAKSAEIVGSTLRIFQKDASKSGEVAEAMAIGFNTSALGLDNFGEAIKYVGPVANAANISLEQTTALLGVLADNGIKGSMAGTSLRKIISDLGQGAAPVLNKRLREMAEAGLSGAAAMDEVGRTAYASLLILANNTDAIDKQIKAQKEMKGTLESTSRIMQDNLQGDLDKLNAAWDRMFVSTSGLIPVFRNLTKVATGFVNALSGDGNANSFLDEAIKQYNYFYTQAGKPIPEGPLKRLKELATQTGREIGYTFDETGKHVMAVFEIVRGGTNGPFTQSNEVPPFLRKYLDISEKLPRTVAVIKKEIEDIDKKIENSSSTEQIIGFQKSIENLKDEMALLLGETSLLEKELLKYRAAHKAYLADLQKVTLAQFVNPEFGTGSTKGSAQFSPDTLTGAQNSYESMARAVAALAEKIKDAKKANKDFQDDFKKDNTEKITNQVRAIATLGDVIGDTLAASIQGGEKFGRALARQVDRAVTELYRLAVAYFLAKAAKDSSYNPIGAIIGLTAGLVAFKAAFAASTKPQSSGTTRGGERLMIGIELSPDAGKMINARITKQNTRDARTKAA